jgi:hypothetical protein
MNLELLESKVKALMDTYYEAEQLLFYTRIVDSIAKNDENKNEFIEKEYHVRSKTVRTFLRFFNNLVFGLIYSPTLKARGGQLAFYLLKRRLKKTTEIILPVCKLYLTHENDENSKLQVSRVIDDINEIIHTFDKEKGGIGIGKIISIITGILGIVLAGPIYAALDAQFRYIPNSSMVALLIVLAAIATLEIYVGTRIFPQIIGYLRVIILYQFNTKELDVYNSLKPLQQFILERNDKIRQLIKKSLLNFVYEVAGELKRRH